MHFHPFHVDHHLGDPRRYSVVHFLQALSTAVIGSIMTLYLANLGYSNQAIGGFLAIYPLLAALASPLIGRAADVVGRRRILMYAAIGQIFSLLIYILSGSLALLVVGRVLDGLAASTLAIVSLAKVEDYFRDHRGARSGVILSLVALSHIVIPPLALLLADFSYVAMPFWFSLFAMVITLLMLILSEEKHYHNHFSGIGNYAQTIKDFLKHPRLRALALIAPAHFFSAPLTRGFLAIYIVEQLGLTKAAVGLALLLFDLPYLAQFYFGRLSDRYPQKERLIIPSLLIGSFLILILGLMPNYWYVVGIMCVSSIFGGILNVSVLHLLSQVGEAEKQEAGVLATYTAFGRFGNFVSSLLAGVVYQQFGFAALAFILGLCSILLTLGAVVILRKQGLSAPIIFSSS